VQKFKERLPELRLLAISNFCISYCCYSIQEEHIEPHKALLMISSALETNELAPFEINAIKNKITESGVLNKPKKFNFSKLKRIFNKGP